MGDIGDYLIISISEKTRGLAYFQLSSFYQLIVVVF